MTTQKWQYYYNLNPRRYHWSFLLPPKEQKDSVAHPQEKIYVGSYITKIPDNAKVIVNVAKEMPNRKDAKYCHRYKVGLPDPGQHQNPYRQFKKAVRLICHLVALQKWITFIHCASGMNRSIVVAATAAAILDQTSVLNKIQQIAKTRPEIWPEPYYVILGEILNKELK